MLDVGSPSPTDQRFYTPPSSPPRPPGTIVLADTKGVLSRRGSRPSSLSLLVEECSRKEECYEIETASTGGDATSPAHVTLTDLERTWNCKCRTASWTRTVHRTNPFLVNDTAMPTVENTNTIMPSRTNSQQHSNPYNPNGSNTGSPTWSIPGGGLNIKSPCFIHSLLEKSASSADSFRLRNLQPPPPVLNNPNFSFPPRVGSNHMSMSDGSLQVSSESSSQSSPVPRWDNLDEEEDSLTQQLANTAVGVREMSRQLGRARVKSNIQNILIITKARDNRLIKLTRELALYLMTKPRNGGRGLVVYVDHQLRHSKRFDAEGIEKDYPELFHPAPRRRSSASSLASMNSDGVAGGNFEVINGSKEEGQLRYWTADMCSRTPHWFDFVVTLGGDGTVLFASWLFQRIVPPVLPFALGSLGFLTPFEFEDHKRAMDNAIDKGIRVSLRMRFTCTVYRAVETDTTHGGGRKAIKKGDTGEILMRGLEKEGWEALEGGGAAPPPTQTKKDKEVQCLITRPMETFEVLNDLVVDRGPSPYVSLLELFADEHHLTTVQADGLTVSTPTGSTAYSLSAGGSLVHPEIPSLLLTPICPHTLSFRPMLLPDSMELRICVPFNSRSTAWASFDGRGRVELKQGDHIKVSASCYPFPTVCADRQSTDWFNSISRTLKWNERERQKSFVVVEEGPEGAISKPPGSETIEEEASDWEQEEQFDEEKYDIDFSNPTAESDNQASAATTPDDGLSASTKQRAMHKAKELDEAKRMSKAARKNDCDETVLTRSLRSAGVSEAQNSSSGVESPDRFGQPHPHPKPVSPRHMGEPGQGRNSKQARRVSTAQVPRLDLGPSTLEEEDPHIVHFEDEGARDHIRNPQDTTRKLSGASASKDVELDYDEALNVKTPRPQHAHAQPAQGAQALHFQSGADGHLGLCQSRPRAHTYHPGVIGAGHRPAPPAAQEIPVGRRAFAAWGQDDSDDSDTN